MEHRTTVTFNIGTGDQELGLAVLQALELAAPEFGPAVGQGSTAEELSVTVAFDSPTGAPDVILGRAMRVIEPAVRGVIRGARFTHANVDLVDAPVAA